MMVDIVFGVMVMVLPPMALVTLIVFLCKWNARTRVQVVVLLVLCGSAAWSGIAGFQRVKAMIRSATDPTSCGGNIRHIGLMMHQYATEHDGKLPKTFGLLVKEGYITTLRVFVCPSSGHSIPADFPDDDNLSTLDLSVLDRIDEWSDYVIVQGVTPDSPPDFILLHEKWGSHNGEGSNIWFMDAHLKWHTREDLDRMLAEQYERMRKHANPDGYLPDGKDSPYIVP